MEHDQISNYHVNLETRKTTPFRNIDDVQNFKSTFETRYVKPNFKNNYLRTEENVHNKKQPLEHRQVPPNYKSIENKNINSYCVEQTQTKRTE